MSKVQLQGNVSGTGIFTIASPNSNTDRVINLPDAAGTLQVSGNPISGTTGTFTGLLDISAAGAGQIKFPATMNPSSDANTLDDYEEGVFTLTANANTSGTITLKSTHNTGRYVKVGKWVFWNTHIRVQSVSSPVGFLTFTGMPFASGNVSTEQNRYFVGVAPIYNFNSPANTVPFGYMSNNSTAFYVANYAGGNTTVAAASYMQTDTELYINGFYETA